MGRTDTPERKGYKRERPHETRRWPGVRSSFRSYEACLLGQGGSMHKSLYSHVLVLLALIVAVACGGGQMGTEPSAANPATIQGTVNGATGGTGLSASSVDASAVKAGIKITI